MTGLAENWQLLPKHSFSCRTSSSENGDKDEILEGILLCEAAEKKDFRRCTVRCADGTACLFTAKDAQDACLAVRSGILTLCFPKDATRRRWLKEPSAFAFE